MTSFFNHHPCLSFRSRYHRCEIPLFLSIRKNVVEKKSKKKHTNIFSSQWTISRLKFFSRRRPSTSITFLFLNSNPVTATNKINKQQNIKHKTSFNVTQTYKLIDIGIRYIDISYFTQRKRNQTGGVVPLETKELLLSLEYKISEYTSFTHTHIYIYVKSLQLLLSCHHLKQ